MLCARTAFPTFQIVIQTGYEINTFFRAVLYCTVFVQALLSTTFKLPEKAVDKFILISIAEDKMRAEFMESVEHFIEMGYNLAGFLLPSSLLCPPS